MTGLGRALAVSVLAHLVPLYALQWPQPRAVNTWRATRLPITLAWRDERPQRPSVDLPTPDPDTPPRRVEIRRRRTVHQPARVAPPDLERYPGPSGPEVAARPPAVAPLFSAPLAAPPHPLVEALSRSTLAGAQPIATPRGSVQLYFLQPGESPGAALAREGPPLVLVSADDAPPEDAALTWVAAGLETRWLNQPESVRSWWALWGTTSPRLGRQDGRLVAIWLPASVRAGWEAQADGALALWDSLVSAPELAGWLSSG